MNTVIIKIINSSKPNSHECQWRRVKKTKRGQRGWTNDLPARAADKWLMITNVPFYQEKWPVSRLQATHQNRMDFRSRHQLLFVCYCRQLSSCRLTDRCTELRHGRLDMQLASYITWWVNGSVEVGQGWCKRVCRQAAISCPKFYTLTSYGIRLHF